MLEIITSEIECALEHFVEEGDMSPGAIKRFKATRLRAIKVDYPHTSARWIDREFEQVWLDQIGNPVNEYFAA